MMPTLSGNASRPATIEFETDYRLILEKIQDVNPVQYAKTRNFITGAVTYLSPYISRGVISVKQVRDTVLSKGYRPYNIQKFLQELAWREYFQRVWQAKNNLIEQDIKQVQPGALHHQMVTAVEQATTGIVSIDAQINNLYATGYMHNHTRMYTAAICCNIAKAHWKQPAKWMYYHLLDGDIASNNCSWQWVAGAFASKKYYCNQENINKYCFSTQRDTFLDLPYEKLPEMSVPDILQSTCNLPLNTVLPQTTVPLIDTSLPTLIYNSYNLDPLWRKEETVNRILLLEPSHFSTYPVSEKVLHFIISLAQNIAGIQIFSGEITALQALYNNNKSDINNAFISKEHPAFTHYPGIKDSREWMYPQVADYYPSFSGYWKQCERYLK